jgi:Flp pilus assembly protein TadG
MSLIADVLRRLRGLHPQRETSGVTRRPRGQVLVIFAGAMIVLFGMMAIVIDVSWYWSSSLRMQRAADAAALAGVVWLPGDPATATTTAFAEAKKNGYENGVNGITITAVQDSSNARRLIVTISGGVSTYFARVVGVSRFPATKVGKAEFVLPVPMGSPENYYGVFGKVRTPAGGTNNVTSGNSGLLVAVTRKAGTGTWTSAPTTTTTQVNDVNFSDNQYAVNSTSGNTEDFGDFSFTFPGTGTIAISGITAKVEAKTTLGTACQLQASLSWNNGTSFTTAKTTPNLTTADTLYTLGSASDLWGRSSWSTSELNNTNFRIRITNVKPGTCTGALRIDLLQVQIDYTQTIFVPDANLPDPYGAALNPRGFWGTFINQGAEKINGDAFLPKWDPRTSGSNAEYDPQTYYNYAIEMPAGSSNGELWIYDPIFCASDTGGQYGTGDRFFSGSANPTDANYDVYDTMNTPYDLNDDTLVASSGTLFDESSVYTDPSLNGPTGSGYVDCTTVSSPTGPNAGAYYHLRWYRIASGLQGGHTYRLHTTSTDPSNPTKEDNANGHNSFALWSKASGGTPRIYGIGAMEAFTPLPGGQSSTFYLAQIDAVHAGKTVEIRLWDPGDTGSLSATLQILQPGTMGYTPATFSYSATAVASGASNCGIQSGTNVTSVVTNTGGNSLFNGCWLDILVPLPSTYSAPQPPGEPGAGWWKINYVMGGSSSSNAFDLTTWDVRIRGNPVHLVP